MCCVLVQQTDAEVIQDTTRNREMSKYSNNTDNQTKWFKREVRALQEEGQRIANNTHGISVAPLIISKDQNVQMSGVIAVFPKREAPLFFQGARKTRAMTGETALDNNPNSLANIGKDPEKVLLAINNVSHTERQLISNVLDKNIRAGTFHIYTYEPPCCKNSDTNANFSCCQYYAHLIRHFPEIEFHVYFDLTDFKSLAKYFEFQTSADLEWLCHLIQNTGKYEQILSKWNCSSDTSARDDKQRLRDLCEAKTLQQPLPEDVVKRIAAEIFNCIQKVDPTLPISAKHVDAIETFFKNKIISFADHGGNQPQNLFIHIIQ